MELLTYDQIAYIFIEISALFLAVGLLWFTTPFRKRNMASVFDIGSYFFDAFFISRELDYGSDTDMKRRLSPWGFK